MVCAAISSPPSRHAVRDRNNDAPQLQQPSQPDSFRQLVVPSIPGVLIDRLSSCSTLRYSGVADDPLSSPSHLCFPSGDGHAAFARPG